LEPDRFGRPAKSSPQVGRSRCVGHPAGAGLCPLWPGLSNRRVFARNFVVLIVTTTLIISIVRTSVALSLGLVGALSIVRFRAAIKEPEELAFLFLAISVGLGLGAGAALITVVALIIILAFFALRTVLSRKPGPPNLYLTVTSPVSANLNASQILEALGASGATPALNASIKRPTSLRPLSWLISRRSNGWSISSSGSGN